MTHHRSNPFTPTFGEAPSYLAGRRELTDAITTALTSPTRRLELTTVLYGARGTGKTTLLSVTSRLAQESGWVTARGVSLPGMLDDIELDARRNAAHLTTPSKHITLHSVNVAHLFEVTVNDTHTRGTNWRSRMTDLLTELEKIGSGLVIMIDEIDPTLDELAILVSTYQIFVAEGRKIALFMAGLPASVSQLLTSKSVSFLRRAQLKHLGKIADYDVREALVKTIRDSERTINTEALDLAVAAIGGFAYLIQLVGYRAWDINPESPEITVADMKLGIELAQAEMEDHIIGASYRELSPGDIRFLNAMSLDSGNSTIADLTKRLGWSSSQVAQYRRRLIEAGLIGERRRGVVGFDLPFLRDYVRKHSDT